MVRYIRRHAAFSSEDMQEQNNRNAKATDGMLGTQKWLARAGRYQKDNQLTSKIWIREAEAGSSHRLTPTNLFEVRQI